MKYHTLSTSTIAESEGKKSSFTIYADIMDFKHEKLEAELLSARRELEGVQTALHQQTQRCRELVTEFSKKLQSKEIQIHSERQLRDQQLTKVLRALLLFEARLVKEQKHIRQQLQEKDTIIYNQQLQIKKLEEPSTVCQQCCKNNSPQSSSSTQESSLSSLETTHNDYNNWSHCAILLPPTILDSSSSDVYASISENDYKNGDQLSVSSEDTNCIRRPFNTNFERKNSFIKNKQNFTKNDLKRMKKYSSNRLKKDTTNSSSSGTYYDVIKRVNRNELADSSSNDDEIKEKTLTDNINDVSKRIENVFEETKDTLRLSQSYSERIENLHGIKRVSSENNRNGSVTDELYTSSSFSGDSSTTTSTNYCSTGDIRGSYEPNGNFNCYSSTKSDSEMTTTSKNNIDDGFAEGDIEIFELNDEEQDNLSKDSNIVFVFDNNKTQTDETENNWYAYASDQEDDQKCDIYKDNPVLECMNQILLQNINDSIHSPPKSPIPTSNNTTLTKSKSPKRVKFLDDGGKIEVASSSEKDETSNKSSQDDYYETPIQNVANVYEVPQSIYSNDYEQILINRNDNAATTKWSKSENLQEKEINRMSSQKLYVIKNIELNETDNDYYYVDMDAKSDSNTSQPTGVQQPGSVRKYPRTPPALPPKPANLVSKYKIHGKPLTAENLSIMNSKNVEQRGEEPDYCSISELNMAGIESHHHPVVNTSSNIVEVSDVQNGSSLYDQIIGNAPNIVSKCSTPLRTEKNPTPSPRQSSEKKKNEPEIPKLPQVSEIIIPSESSDTESKDENLSVTHDNYIKNNSQLFKKKNEQKYKTPIVMGTSVSSLITGFNKQHIMAELNSKVLSNTNTSSNLKKSPRKSCSNLFTNFDLNQNCDKQIDNHQISKSTSDIPLSFEKFDLSQNFEEFNLDDCEITEEYRIDDLCNDSEPPSPTKSPPKCTLSPKKSASPTSNVKKTIKYKKNEVLSTTSPLIPTQQTTVLPTQQNNNKNITNVPKTNKNSVIPHQTLLTYENQQPNYEHFLECTGLSSKSILTPSRLLSNHKSMLKPKDVKLRNKVRTYATVEKQQNGNTIKYYSEPYL
ncbi:uncharacterized protein LOC123291432 [Chrysoperla carnea]|uniref:uncharacterized protein LOC123291432 n=1 Tax=Chrysoperla carnea TaxID=189513 RepID=UPI001D089A25|nr:uncharacterized protein LOC123291432 [Chrysoperla carnea]